MTCVNDWPTWIIHINMRTIGRTVTFLTAALAGVGTFAQDPQQGWLVNTMYQSGKINAVVAVVAVVLSGLAVWLFTMDRRLRKLEQEQHRN